MPTLAIKSGTTEIAGSVVKGSFSYFSGSTKDLGPTNVTGFYSGVDAPSGGYTVYQIGGSGGWTARVATDDASLNSILISAGGTGSTVDQNITWATNTNSVYVNSGTTSAATSTSYYVGGNFTTFSGISQNRLIRLNTDGSKDTSFDIGTGLSALVWSVAIQSDGKVLAVGNFINFTGTTNPYIIRLNTDGSKDTSFVSPFGGSLRSVAIQSDGKIVAGGFFTSFDGATQNRLIRLNTDGSKDTSFDIGTGFNSTLTYNGLAIQSDGKVLVGGLFTTFTGATQNKLIRLNTDGSKDTSFDIGSGFNLEVISVEVQSDGKVLAGGLFTTFTGETNNRLIRLNTDGSKDTSFNIGTGFNGDVNSIAIQSDGKVLVGGAFTTFTGETNNRLIRLNTDGSKDTSFNIGTGFNTTIFSVVIQSDGKVLVGGNFITFSGETNNRLIRLNSDGSKDTSFNIGTGFSSTVQTVVIN